MRRRSMTIKLTRNLGFLLLGIWLILTGLLPLLDLGRPGGLIMSLLALAAGILILLGRQDVAPRRRKGRGAWAAFSERDRRTVGARARRDEAVSAEEKGLPPRGAPSNDRRLEGER